MVFNPNFNLLNDQNLQYKFKDNKKYNSATYDASHDPLA